MATLDWPVNGIADWALTQRPKWARFIIYLHRNRVTGKAYVGQTKQTMRERWLGHVKSAGKLGRGCRALSTAIQKYGAQAFDHEVLDVLSTQAGADSAEAAWIKRLGTLVPSGYNLDSGRYCGVGRSFHHSAETKRLMSEKARLREARMTPRERSARVCKAPPEVRSRIARERWERTTLEQRVERGRRISLALASSERNTAAIRKRWQAMTPQQRSDHSRKAHEAQTPEQRRERGKKAWGTYRARRPK